MDESVRHGVRVALVHANDGSDVRVGKTCRSLARLGFETHFIGWDRRPSRKSMDLGGAELHVMCRATNHGRWTPHGYMAFLWHVISVLMRVRPDVVCAVNEELTFLLLPFKGMLFRRLICELYDSLDARHSDATHAIRVLSRAISAGALRFADRLVVTDDNRLRMTGKHAGKATVIENVPEDPGPELAEKVPAGPVRIWVGGSLDEAHGLRHVLDAIQPLPDTCIVSAGWTYDDFAASTFVSSPRVDYRGIITAAQALELASGCDAVFCYYAPINVNMINASPNKVNDALAIGRPILINSEVKLASWVVESGAGIAIAYDDVEGLRQAIADLGVNRPKLPAFAKHSRAVFSDRSWNAQEPKLARLYQDLADERTRRTVCAE